MGEEEEYENYLRFLVDNGELVQAISRRGDVSSAEAAAALRIVARACQPVPSGGGGAGAAGEVDRSIGAVGELVIDGGGRMHWIGIGGGGGAAVTADMPTSIRVSYNAPAPARNGRIALGIVTTQEQPVPAPVPVLDHNKLPPRALILRSK